MSVKTVILQSCIFHPCYVVRHCWLDFGFSCPAFSAPPLLYCVVQWATEMHSTQLLQQGQLPCIARHIGRSSETLRGIMWRLGGCVRLVWGLGACATMQLAVAGFNTLEFRGNYSATSNTTTVDGWAVTFGTARRGWVGPQPAQGHSRCTKCNSPPINGQCTNHRIAV